MKLLSAGLVDKVNDFLHAGYISASPRPLDASAYPGVGLEGTAPVDPVVQLDLRQALELAPDVGDNATGLIAGTVHGGTGDHRVLVFSLVLAAAAATIYILRTNRVPRWAQLTAALLLACATGAFAPSCNDGEEALPTVPPWEGVTLQDYADPASATLAIIHGIVVPAVTNIGQGVEVLANVQDEVSLPTTSPTEGMSYALQTYGIDGWGNALRLDRSSFDDGDGHELWNYTVASAGEDGGFDTDDDISTSFFEMYNGSWGFQRNVYYLVKNGDDVDVVFHRWNNKMFEYVNEDRAAALSGGELLDLFVIDDFYIDDAEMRIHELYDEVASEADGDPLVMQVFEDSLS